MLKHSLWVLLLLVTAAFAWAQYTPGGLVALPTTQNGPERVANGDFESGTTGWTIPNGGFSSATDYYHSGTKSLKFVSGSVSTAYQTMTLPAGTYHLAGSWFTNGVAFGNSSSYMRICLTPKLDMGTNCAIVYGTAATWTQFNATSLSVTGGTYYLQFQLYNGPSPTIWFDDVSVVQDLYPVRPFMTYPNYRGMLWSDGSQIATFDTTVTPPNGYLANYKTAWTITDETTATTVLSTSHASVAQEVISVDANGWNSTHKYTVSFRLLLAFDNSVVYTYPSYRIVPTAATVRTNASIVYGADNRFLMSGTPKFLLGVYDSGLDYSTTMDFYTNQWNQLRRLNQLPGINYYYDYWWGGASNTAMLPALDAAVANGMVMTFGNNCVQGDDISPAFWLESGEGTVDANVQTRGARHGFGGWYVADECPATAIPTIFSHYPRQKALSPTGINTFANFTPAEFVSWRDAVDVLGADPYPVLNQAEATAEGRPTQYDATSDLSINSTWVKSMRDAVVDSRPVMVIVQFWGDDNYGHSWPTRAQLRNMSYMSVAEGANGLVFWEIGQGSGALQATCDGSTTNRAYPGQVLLANAPVGGGAGLWLPGVPGGATWVINSGSIPGASFNGNGVLSGTPTTPGTYYINGTANGTITGYVEFIVLSTYTGTNYYAGANAWCDSRETHFADLKAVITEFSGLQTTLASTDDSARLVANTESGVHTRVKAGTGGYHYLIASNNSANTVTPTFTWATSPWTITVYNESRSITPNGLTFSDSFGPWQAHVYQIADGQPSSTTYAVSISKAGAGSGTVTSIPAGINCGATCTANFSVGSQTTLATVATTGSRFVGWSGGGCSGTGSCIVASDAMVTASFDLIAGPQNYSLSVTKSGYGSGTVTGDGVNCGSTCSEIVVSGTSVTLTATAATGSTFAGWTGSGCSGTGTCAITLNADAAVTASFNLAALPYLLTLSKSGGGTVTSGDTLVNCGSVCSAQYATGSSVTLTASPAAGYVFSGWSGGGCAGTSTCTVTVTANTNVLATFAVASSYTLAVSKSGAGTGTVTSGDLSINCGATCSASFAANSVVTLTATPTANANFKSWSGGCSGKSSVCVLTMNAAKSVSANFSKVRLRIR